MKIRVIIDAEGEIFLVVMARTINTEDNIAVISGNQITDMSENF
jgi:hypothetical protein